MTSSTADANDIRTNGNSTDQRWTEQNDRQLMKLIGEGSKAAMTEFITRYYQRITDFAQRHTGRRSDAEDIAQEAFFRAWQALPSFRFQSAFRTWIYRIVVNLCINRFPRLRRELDDLVPAEMTELPEIRKPETDPAAGLEDRELRALLHQEIERLPDSQRLLSVYVTRMSCPMRRSPALSDCQ